MTSRCTTLLAAAAAFACTALPVAAVAQSKSDAFAGKIPPVSGQLYSKAGRFEVTATGNISLNDAFFTKYFGGVKAGYHFTESLSTHLHFAGGAAVNSGSAVVCSATAGCANADTIGLRQVPGRMRWLVGADAAWSPIYGKLNFFSEKVAHFDLSIFAGPDFIAYDEVLAKEDASRTPGTKTSIGGHVGVGARVFVTQAIAVRLELKDYLYPVKVPNVGPGNELQNQLFAELGVSFFLPTRNRPVSR